MKESFPVENSPEEAVDSQAVERHKDFFSAENLKNLLGDAIILGGAAISLAGIYQYVSGSNLEQLAVSSEEYIAHAINWVVANVDSMPVTMKAGGGPAVMAVGVLLKNFFNKKENNQEGSEK